MVIGSDTAVWNAPGGVAVSKYRQHFDPAIFTRPETNAFGAMSADFRHRFVDSFSQPLKMTWWLLVGSVYGQSDNTDVPVPNLMPLYLMRKYHGDAIAQFGDEITLHYHTFLWSDYNADGIFFWNEAKTFHECRDDWDLALAQSLIEEEVFPVSFRSGWHYMDNEWQQYLNELLPYNMDDDSPHLGLWSTNEPTYNVLDWSKAPVTFVPYQPSSTNYQIPGDGPGWNVRSVKFPNVTQAMLNDIFAQAANGIDQVVSFWGHLPESDFLPNIAKMDAFTQIAASNNPAVHFRYCTAVEAMKRWRGISDDTAPTLDVDQGLEGETVTLTLQTSEAIFQTQPFVAVKDIFQHYRIVSCERIDSTTWKAALPFPREELAKVGVAVTDLAGNLTTRFIHFLPDDLYIDNLDASYLEIGGRWSTTQTAAWGVDARVAAVDSNETAQVRWNLPISVSGKYNILAQVPAVTNAAGNISFNVRSGESNISSIFFPNPMSSNQWVYLFTPFLVSTVTNSLEMLVTGDSQTTTNAVAVADVIRISPLALALPGFIGAVAVDRSDTTASITWTTASPSSGLVEYGLDATYGSFSGTNLQSSIHHVISLTGLKAGTNYAFRINSSTKDLSYPYQGTFSTLASPPNNPPMLHYLREADKVTLYWNGMGLRLQRSDLLGGSVNDWFDVELPAPGNLFLISTDAPAFYRLVFR